MSVSYTPRRYWHVVKLAGKEWKKINKEELQYEIRKLYQSKLIKKEENSDGSITMVLTDRGRRKAITFNFENIRIDKKSWDGYWRLLVFDIPEKNKHGRDALRRKIKQVGFHELQKSVFIFPYRCEDELDFIIEFFNMRKYVRIGLLKEIDNEKHLKKVFNLS
jgi:DNA-binding transcriptional regulator PaaX